MCGSEARIQSLGTCQICETVLFFFFFSKELFVQILCLLNQVPKLMEEEGRGTGLAFVQGGTFCAFQKNGVVLFSMYNGQLVLTSYR